MRSPSIIFLLLLQLELSAQQLLQINHGIDTLNIENKGILKKWQKYITYDNEFLNREKYADFNEYWAKEAIQKNKYPDLLNYNGALSPSLLELGLNNKVISISKRNNYYIIKSIFYYTETDASFVPVAITNYPLKKENGGYYFYNILDINTHNWKEKRVGQILYHYSSAHKFNSRNAKKTNKAYFILTSLFGVPFEKLDYYIYESCDNLYNTIGFDYKIGMGGKNNKCGYFDARNNIIHTGGYENPEFHEHELIHIINNSFTNAHDWFLAGISGYWGGHFEKDLKYHIERVYNYYKNDTTVNLNNILDYEQLDDFTNPVYVFGGIFCHLALEKNGIEGLKRLFSYGKSEEDFYLAIQKELSINRTEIHRIMLNLLQKYSSEGLPTISYKNLSIK
ncbi:hypothetical protein [Emticicia sp. BO119]|uniref:hypothetical protein n=1 Tax=Emticicia sp. BO119 TaxID=2757768 RepID=UPI0015F00FBE|nr:hypothetical protein [Emticicia sp. BO119]MBA4849840.1 hypothetical protein [Emticicia sp. BO119]